MKQILYILGLTILTALIWEQIYSAQFLDYDDNFGQLIGVFLLSLLLLVTGIVLFVKKIALVRSNQTVNVLFLVINSPPTIFLAVTYYEVLFGTTLRT